LASLSRFSNDECSWSAWEDKALDHANNEAEKQRVREKKSREGGISGFEVVKVMK
jgi:hypothetical protein